MIWLALLAALSEACYIGLSRLDATNGWTPVLSFLGWMGALFAMFAMAAYLLPKTKPSRARWWLIAVAAVVFRLTLLPAGLSQGASLADDWKGEQVAYDRFQLFDNDIWRYLWDGHLVAHGRNPYVEAVRSPAVDDLAPDGAWAEIRENVSYPEITTIYPPLAEAMFALVHALVPGSVSAMKAMTVVFDLATAVLLALLLRALGQDPAWCLLYAWNPLVVKVFAGSGHIDSLLNALIAGMLLLLVTGKKRAAAAVFGLTILAKLSPLILVPLLWRRIGIKGLLISASVVLLGYLPFAAAGLHVLDGFLTFARNWEFNGGPYQLFRLLGSPAMARALCGVCLLGLAGWHWRKDDGGTESLLTGSGDLLGALAIFSPAVMPWYTTWAQTAAIASKRWPWVWLTGLVCLAFFVMVDGRERVWALVIEYGVLAMIWAITFMRKRTNQLTS